MDWINKVSRCDPVERGGGSFEHGNKLSDFTKKGGVLDQMSDYKVSR
jgi:hypothetical protein